MSSRLSNIREKQGLAYAVFSELTPIPTRNDDGLRRHAKEKLQVIDLTIKEFPRFEGNLWLRRRAAPLEESLQGSLMLRSNPPARACPISPPRNCILAASIRSTKFRASKVTHKNSVLSQVLPTPNRLSPRPLNGFTLDRPAWPVESVPLRLSGFEYFLFAP